MASQRNKVNASIPFIGLQLVLYAAFMALDITEAAVGLSCYIKYTVIILCFCYAYLCAGKGIIFTSANRRELWIRRLLVLAMLFTLISDLFLLILDYYLFGVLSFIPVQLLYGLRLKLIDSKGHHYRRTLKQILAQLLITGITVALLIGLQTEINLLLIVTVFYFICIVTNVIHALLLAAATKGDRSNLLFALGMLLFLLCDINVGLFNMGGFLELPEHIYQPIYSAASILMWTFYAPSQVLITLSGHRSGR